MYIDGMTLIVGSKGSGKSAVAVSLAIRHLKKGGVVAANFSLKDGWADKIACMHIRSYFSEKFRYEYAQSLYSRFFEVRNVESIMSIEPEKLAIGRHKIQYHANGEKKYHEGAGLLLLDECGLFLNCRKSMSGDKNMSWVEFFTQARKLGWFEVLIAHKAEMIDSQIRDMAEFEARFRNLQKVNIPWLGIPIVPFPVFLMICKYAGLGPGSGSRHSMGALPLPLWAARLYDSKLLFKQSMFNGVEEACHSGKPPRQPDTLISLPKIRISQIADSCINSKWVASECL